MFTNTLSSDTFRGIKLLGQSKLVDFAYLAGGTAVALRLGHRQSVDLDFFTKHQFSEEAILADLGKTGEFIKDQVAWQTIMGSFCKVKFSLFFYEYKILSEADDFLGVKIAGLEDLAPMKLHAIEDRGSKRDFVDLFWICKEIELVKIFDLYQQKYGNLEDRKYHILRSLNYFEDAESDTVKLQLKKPVDWEEVKEFFVKEVKQLAKEWGFNG
ncbi:MAG: nucleotidyl transferase AbiEii/AbiGii toxin family protein [Candidatus Beckwithbacteria bacterium]|nr:nucleotidyl transferase AbiEii/AbiGii toxin family protein [Patescibacteria group bacterium]